MQTKTGVAMSGLGLVWGLTMIAGAGMQAQVKKPVPAPAPAAKAVPAAVPAAKAAAVPVKPGAAAVPAVPARTGTAPVPGRPAATLPGRPAATLPSTQPGGGGTRPQGGVPMRQVPAGSSGSSGSLGRPGGSSVGGVRDGVPGAPRTAAVGANREMVRGANLTPGVHPTGNGGKIMVSPDGRRTEFNRQNQVTAWHRTGMDVRNGPNGRPTMVRMERPGGEVHTMYRGPGGMRIAEGYHPAVGGGQMRVLSYGPHRGAVYAPMYGHPGYMRGTYLRDGRSYAVVYRGYHYGRYEYYRPVPNVVYAPEYYGWAARPWSAPVAIQVGFLAAPYYTAYPGVFQPYASYASPDQWMTDQMLAQNLQNAYAADQDAGARDAGYAPVAPPTITPELKQQFNAQVAQEVKESGQVAAAGVSNLAPPLAAVTEELPDALKPGHVIFRVVSTLAVQSTDGDACSLNQDDWVIRNGEMDEDGTVEVRVAATRKTDCGMGSAVRVSLNDLMAMQNEQNEQIQMALKTASETLGKYGMPAAAPVTVPGGQTSADLTVATVLAKEQTEAAAAEQQAVATVGAAQ